MALENLQARLENPGGGPIDLQGPAFNLRRAESFQMTLGELREVVKAHPDHPSVKDAYAKLAASGRPDSAEISVDRVDILSVIQGKEVKRKVEFEVLGGQTHKVFTKEIGDAVQAPGADAQSEVPGQPRTDAQVPARPETAVPREAPVDGPVPSPQRIVPLAESTGDVPIRSTTPKPPK